MTPTWRPLLPGTVLAGLGAWLAGPLGAVSGGALGLILGGIWEVRGLGEAHRSLIRLAAGDALRIGEPRRAPHAPPTQGAPLGPALQTAASHLERTFDDFRVRQRLIDQVLDATPQAIVVCDAEGRVVLANRTANDLFHHGAELTGTVFAAVLESCPPGMRQAVLSQADHLFTVDGDTGEDAWLVSRPFFELNTRRYTLYVVKEVTRELGRQEVAIWKKMIRVVGHELNNSLAPVSSLLHSARLVAGKPEHAHRLDDIFDTIAERIGHLRTFIEGYARFARLAPPDPRPVAWRPFLDGLRALYDCTLDLPAAPPAARFDHAQVQQALINLLKNAREAGSPPEQTTLAVAVEGRGLRLSVLDRGHGMPEAVRTQAVLPFYSTKKAGTGLGLALVREVAEAHGGQVRLEARPDGGTAVHLILPLEPPGGTAPPPSAAPPPEPA